MADSIQDITTRSQVILERVKSGFDRSFGGVARSLRSKIRETFSKLDVETLDELSLTKLNLLLARLERDMMAITTPYMDDFEKSLDEVARLTAQFEVRQLATLETGALPAIVATVPKTSKMLKEALRQPIQATGDLLEPFVKDWPEMDAKRVNKVIRTGWSQGKTPTQMAREIAGTAKNKFADGQIETSRRHAAAVTHTASQHVATVARAETWLTSDQIEDRFYYWVATLDRRTTEQCRSLETLHGTGSGDPLEHGKGPKPPIHVNCRSGIAPAVPKEYEFLLTDTTRASSGVKPGQVKGTLTYYDWLKTQPASFQDVAIGKKRGKLLRNGGLTSKEFANLSLDKNFAPLTLRKMEKINPDAFSKANVKP